MCGGNEGLSIRKQHEEIIFKKEFASVSLAQGLLESQLDSEYVQPGTQERMFSFDDAATFFDLAELTADSISDLQFATQKEALAGEDQLSKEEKKEKQDLLDEEIRKKRDDLMEAMLGFEVLAFDQSLAEKTVAKREQKARELEVPRTLYSTSQEQRIRVLKSLKLDEATKKQLLKEGKSMEEILHTHVKEEEQHRLAKEGKAFFNLFQKAKAELNNNPLLSAEDKAMRLYRLAKPYETSIVMYKDEYFTTLDASNRQQMIEDLLDRVTRFFDLHAASLEVTEEKRALWRVMGITENEATVNVGRVATRAREIDKSEGLAPEQELDKNLSQEQIAGVEAVDRFLIEHGGSGESHGAFMDKLLRLSMRDRLLLYGLVEKDRTAAPNAADIAVSQLSYVPDLSAFERRMRSVSGFFWGGGKRRWVSRHLHGMHWEKLEAALAVINKPEVIEVRDAFARLQGTESEVYDQSVEAVENITETKDGDPTQDELLQALTRRESERDKQLLVTIQAVEKCRDAMLEAEKSVFHKKEKRKLADQAVEKAKREVQNLEDRDRILADTIRIARETANLEEAETGLLPELDSQDKVDEKIKSKPQDSTFKKAIGGMSTVSTYAAKGTTVLSKINKMATLGGATGMASTVTSFTAFFFGGVTGVLGLFGALVGFANTIKTVKDHGSSIATSDIVNMATKNTRAITGGLWGMASSAYSTGLTIAKIVASKKTAEVAKVMTDNIGIATDVLTGASIAVSGFKAAVDIGEAAVQVKHYVHHGIADYHVYQAKKTGELTGDEAAYADNILRVDRRNKTNQSFEIVNSFVLNAAGVVTTIGGGAIGAIVHAGVSLIDFVAMKFIMKGLKKWDRSSMVDDFLQLDDTARKLYTDFDNKKRGEKSKIRDALRHEMMAELGFTSKEAFAKHIIGNYAAFLYDKLFYTDGLDEEEPAVDEERGEQVVNQEEQQEQVNQATQNAGDQIADVGLRKTRKQFLASDEKGKRLSRTSRACYQIVKSLGLKVRFPKKEGEQGEPSRELIASKLMG
ncbi:MAG: hypothetical protein K6G83_05135 [Lachnospiraceae bacterium]|nr:hypothetical protein [Lachnospiraceae bacterium]